MVSIVVAVASNGIIGGNNTLLWHIGEDMRMFRRLTTGHTVIMGRRTFESLGRPLPNRRNIVITSSLKEIDGCETARSLDEALKMASDEEETFIIGGGSVYREALPKCTRLYLTEVHRAYEGDVSFPEIDRDIWRETSRQDFSRGEKFEYPFSFVVLERKS